MSAPDCTGISATYCPVHGDCTCPRPTDTGYEPMEYLNASDCPLHAPTSTHGAVVPTLSDVLLRLADRVRRVRALEDAITEHALRKRADLTPDQIDPADERLWSVLDP